MDDDRFEKIESSPESATFADLCFLIANCKRLHWDYTEAMRQYDIQQERACKAEAELERLRGDLHNAENLCGQLRRQIALLQQLSASRAGRVPG